MVFMCASSHRGLYAESKKEQTKKNENWSFCTLVTQFAQKSCNAHTYLDMRTCEMTTKKASQRIFVFNIHMLISDEQNLI